MAEERHEHCHKDCDKHERGTAVNHPVERADMTSPASQQEGRRYARKQNRLRDPGRHPEVALQECVKRSTSPSSHEQSGRNDNEYGRDVRLCPPRLRDLTTCPEINVC